MDKREFQEQMLKYEFALKTLETQLQILLQEYAFKNKYNPVEHVKSRIKTKESALKKLLKRGYDLTIENMINHVHDMVGIRIVCSFLSDVRNIVDLIKESTDYEIIEEKDYILNPKKTGYISYHLRIKVPVHLNEKTEYVEAEIQIRTIAMDFWATLDHKIRYKFEDSIPEEVMNEMYNCSIDIKELDNKMEKLNNIMNKYK